MAPKLVAICGAKRSGKDTIAGHLVDTRGYRRLAFADPMKHIVGYLFGFSRSQMETDEKDESDARWNISPRQALQFFGTEMMQYKIQELLPDVGRLFWVKRLSAEIERDGLYVISDLRFVHEYEELKKEGAYVIRVERPTVEQSDAHASEQDYKNIPADLVLINDSDVASLLIKLDDALSVE